MSQKSFFILFPLCAVLNGCGIGGFWMNGNPFPTQIKPYMSYWYKEGMTEESREVDWVVCGGDSDGGFSMHMKKMRPGETNETSRIRQASELKTCLTQRGYRNENANGRGL